MIGSWQVLVHQVNPFTIHGDQYFELHISKFDEPDRIFSIKVPQHAVKQPPAAGQKLSITFLMGQVTAVQPM